MATEWLNLNSGRSYPFKERTVGASATGTLKSLPFSAVVDAGFVAGPHSRFTPGEHTVRLLRVSRNAGEFFFEFISDAPGLAGVSLFFSRSVTASPWEREFADSGQTGNSLSGSASSHDDGTLVPQNCAEPGWWGYLVTGDLSALRLLLPADGELVGADTDAILEPSLVQSVSGTYVTAVNIANADRTRTTSPDGCDEGTLPYEPGLVYVAASCLQGVIRFKAGYNGIVDQADDLRRITLSADAGRGKGLPCGPVPLFPGDSEDDGAPRCNDVLRAINGIGGPNFDIEAAGGVTVTPVPSQNKLIVSLHGRGLGICTDEISSVSLD